MVAEFAKISVFPKEMKFPSKVMSTSATLILAVFEINSSSEVPHRNLLRFVGDGKRVIGTTFQTDVHDADGSLQ